MPAPASPPAVTWPVVPKGTRQAFWLGVVKDAPVFVVRVGNVVFQRETFSIATDDQGVPLQEGNVSRRDYRLGLVVRLSAAQIEMLKERVPLTFVESFELPDKTDRQGKVVESHRRRARVVKGYRLDAGRVIPRALSDEDDAPDVSGLVPVARYLYLLPAESRGRYDGGHPPTLG